MYQLLIEQGYDCHNFDLKNGSDCDLTDDAVWDPILRDVAAGEYAACCKSGAWYLFPSYTLAPVAHFL